MQELDVALQEILENFTKYTAYDIDSLAKGRPQLVLPRIPVNYIFKLIDRVIDLFSSEPTMLNISSPCIIVGDIHGHLLDLLRVIKHHGLPIKKKYIFLGDVVDRGEFSLECVIIIFILKVLYPKSVYIIRGNHEFNFLCYQFGFHAELQEKYSDSNIYSSFLEAFSYMPIAAIVDKFMLCVHGGIGPSLNTLQQISNIKRPLTDYNDQISQPLLWSDPSDTVHKFSDSPRGMGYLFGKEAANQFLTHNKIKVLVRGHESIAGGVEMRFNNSIITVFTASNYCGLSSNLAGVLIVKPGEQFKPDVYPPLTYLTKDKVKYSSEMLDLKPIQAFSVGFQIKSEGHKRGTPLNHKKNHSMVDKPINITKNTNSEQFDFMKVDIMSVLKHRRVQSGPMKSILGND